MFLAPRRCGWRPYAEDVRRRSPTYRRSCGTEDAGAPRSDDSVDHCRFPHKALNAASVLCGSGCPQRVASDAACVSDGRITGRIACGCRRVLCDCRSDRQVRAGRAACRGRRGKRLQGWQPDVHHVVSGLSFAPESRGPLLDVSRTCRPKMSRVVQL